MKNKQVVLIAISFGSGEGISVIECLGVFGTYAEAYGEAALHLTDMADGSDEKLVITPIFDLEAETGYGMALKAEGGGDGPKGWTDCCYILEAPEKEVGPHGSPEG